MSKKILNVATFGLSGLLLGGKKRADTPPPSPTTPTVMPTADDEKVRLARKRSIVSQLGRKGRESTMLSGGKLGG